MGIAISSRSQTSLQVELNGLGKPANGYYNFRATIYRGSTFVDAISWTSSGTVNYTRNTFYGLDPDTYYTIYGYVQSLASSSEVSWGSVSGYTDAPPPPPSTPSSVSAYASSSNYGAITASWSSVSNADYYNITIRKNSSSGAFVLSTTSYYLSESFMLDPGTTYVIGVSATNSNGTSGTRWSSPVTTTSQSPPSTPSWIDATASSNISSISVSWASVSDITGYVVRLYYANGSLYTSTSTTSTNYNFSGLPEYTSFYAYVHAYNDGGSSSGRTSSTVQTPDLTGPIFSSFSVDGNGRANASWSAYDSGSGLRPTSTYYCEITNANGTTYGNGIYTTNSFVTFTTDGNGLALENGAYYYIRVTAVDNVGNTRVRVSDRFQYTATRPTNWEWYSPKTQGGTFNLTVAEWNAFCRKINEFRLYKGFKDPYPFTVVYAGNNILASQINEAIDAMDNFATVPSMRYSGQNATALVLNNLRDYLNAVA